MSRLSKVRKLFKLSSAVRKMLGIDNTDTQVVVVLQGDEAFWFKWRERELVETHVEPVEAEALSRHIRCPWVQVPDGESQLPVRLVLDTSLDELDRVKAAGLSGRWTGTLQRYRLRRRVQSEYPLASVYDLPGYMVPDVLSVVHHVLPDHWEKWLLQLQAHEVCITHVVTALELFCLWSAENQLSQADDSGDGQGVKSRLMLINALVAKEQRHLLVDRGVPLFMRLADGSHVEPSEGEGAALALTATLTHIRDQVVRHDRQPVVVVPTLPWPSPSAEFAAARVLAALCIGRTVTGQPIDAVGERAAKTPEHHPLVAAPAVELTETPVREPVRRLRSATGRRMSSDTAWRLSNGDRPASAALQISVARNRLRRRIVRLQRATVLCALMALLTMTFAAVHGLVSARERARLSGEQRLLGRQISHLTEVALMLNAEPTFASRSIERIGSHDAVRPLEPQAILAMIAGAISDFPVLVINSLSWSVVDGDTSADTVLATIARVNAREQLWSADSHRARIQLELTGTIGVDLGLREQQLALESFIDHLTTLPGVARVNVLESPVNMARSSKRLSVDESSYRLSLLLESS